jgi:hypothetical protein
MEGDDGVSHGRTSALGALPHPQILDQLEEHSVRYECLVQVIAAVFDLQHHVRAKQGARI